MYSTWLLLSSICLGLAFFGLVLSYLVCRSSIWRIRYRDYDGYRYLGFVHEAIFIVLVYAAVLINGWIFREAFPAVLLEQYWWLIILAVLVLALTSYQCLSADQGCASALKEFEACSAMQARHAAIMDFVSNRDVCVQQLQQAYRAYFFYALGNIVLILVALLTWVGSVAMNTYDLWVLSGEVPAPIATHLSLQSGSEQLNAVQQLLAKYGLFHAEAQHLANRALLGLLVILWPLLWFLGTSYKKVFDGTLVKTFRWIAFLLVCVCLSVLMFIFLLLQVYNNEAASFMHSLAIEFNYMASVAADRAGANDLLSQFNAAHIEFSQRENQSDFLLRLAASLGGVLFILHWAFYGLIRKWSEHPLLNELLPEMSPSTTAWLRALIKADDKNKNDGENQ